MTDRLYYSYHNKMVALSAKENLLAKAYLETFGKQFQGYFDTTKFYLEVHELLSNMTRETAILHLTRVLNLLSDNLETGVFDSDILNQKIAYINHLIEISLP